MHVKTSATSVPIPTALTYPPRTIQDECGKYGLEMDNIASLPAMK